MNIGIAVHWAHVLLAAMSLLMLAQGCAPDRRPPAALSIRDIEKMGPAPSLDDVAQLTGGLQVMEMPYIEYPASAGGIYVFLFVPTNEALTPPGIQTEGLSLLAVIQTPSHDAFMRAEGVYVFPKTISGRRFTGIVLPEEEASPEEKKL